MGTEESGGSHEERSQVHGWIKHRAKTEAWGDQQWIEWRRRIKRLSELGAELEDIELTGRTLTAYPSGVSELLKDEDRYPLLTAAHRLAFALTDPPYDKCSVCGRQPDDEPGWHVTGTRKWLCPNCSPSSA